MRILLRSIAWSVLLALTMLVCVVIVPATSCIGAQYALARLDHGGSPEGGFLLFGTIVVVFGFGAATARQIEALSHRSPGQRIGVDVAWRLIAAYALLYVLAGALAIGIAALGWAFDFYTESEFIRKQGPVMVFALAYTVVLGIGSAAIYRYIIEWRYEKGDI